MKQTLLFLFALLLVECSSRPASTAVSEPETTETAIEQADSIPEKVDVRMKYGDEWASPETMCALLEELLHVEGIRQLDSELDAYAYQERRFSYNRDYDYFIEYPKGFIPQYYSSPFSIHDCLIMSPDSTVFISTFSVWYGAEEEDEIYFEEIEDGRIRYVFGRVYKGCVYGDRYFANLFISMPLEKKHLIKNFQKYIDAFPYLDLTQNR